MAYVGLRKPIIAGLKDDGTTYNTPFACGKAIGINVTPTYAEGSLYADDEKAEYDKEFIYADVTMNTSTLPIQAHKEMFGHAVTEETEVTYTTDDEAKYVGMGWISVEKENGARKFVGNFLPKVKFGEPAGDYSTKGENVEYKTPSISGQAIANTEKKWKRTKTFDTEAEALDYINKTCFGVTGG